MTPGAAAHLHYGIFGTMNYVPTRKLPEKVIAAGGKRRGEWQVEEEEQVPSALSLLNQRRGWQ